MSPDKNQGNWMIKIKQRANAPFCIFSLKTRNDVVASIILSRLIDCAAIKSFQRIKIVTN